jgi:arsenate reductase
MKDLPLDARGVVLQDIKTSPITAEQIDRMAELAGSFEALFSRRSMKFRPMGLHEKQLTEDDYRSLILQEYTFLKRPVLVTEDAIAIGNAKAEVARMHTILHS